MQTPSEPVSALSAVTITAPKPIPASFVRWMRAGYAWEAAGIMQLIFAGAVSAFPTGLWWIASLCGVVSWQACRLVARDCYRYAEEGCADADR